MDFKKTFASLKFRDFRLFWIGSLVSQIGTQMQNVAVNWQIYITTHSALALGMVGLATFLPIVLFSLLGGIAADKFNRKYLLIISQLFQAFFALMFFISSFYGFISPSLIYILLFLNTIALTINAPSRQAVIPVLVPKEYFMNAVSLNTLVRQASTVIGPAIAGFMIEYWGIESVYVFNTISFFVLIATLIPLTIEIHDNADKVTYSFKSIFEGIKFVCSEPMIYSTMLLDFFATFFSSATTLLPIFAHDILNIGARGLGILYASPAIGAVIAGLIVSSMGHIKKQGEIILISVFVYGLATIGFGLSGSFYLSLLFLAIVGASDMVSTIIRNTIRQVLTPDNLRGRMVSINMIFFQGGPQIGETEAGIAAHALGAPASVVVGGIGTIISTALVAFYTPKLKKYQG